MTNRNAAAHHQPERGATRRNRDQDLILQHRHRPRLRRAIAPAQHGFRHGGQLGGLLQKPTQIGLARGDPQPPTTGSRTTPLTPGTRVIGIRSRRARAKPPKIFCGIGSERTLNSRPGVNHHLSREDGARHRTRYESIYPLVQMKRCPIPPCIEHRGGCRNYLYRIAMYYVAI